MPGDLTRPTPIELQVRIAVQVMLGLYLVAAIAWWWAMPGGFPIGHPRFWANAVVPVVVLLTAAFGLAALWTTRHDAFAATLTAFAVLSGTGVVVAVILFPVSSRRLLVIGLPVVLVQTLFAAQSLGKRWPAWTLLICGSCLAMMMATVVVFAQQGPSPRTIPRNVPLSVVALSESPKRSRVKLNQHVAIDLRRGVVDVRSGNLRIECQPRLTFHDYSPDRCWSILRPRRLRNMPQLKLSAVETSTSRVDLAYGPDSCLSADSTNDNVLRLEAFRRLPQPVYSHLNSFCEVTVSGHQQLFLCFSPCAGVPFEPLPADCPVGRPARMAYRNAKGEFHVVEASSGEKGPFQQLAHGRIERDEPLSITLYDTDRKICRIAFDDWSAQADTQLSPTAGWGLPVNSIEFQRLGDSKSAAVKIWISLAATSVGRGWDTVGHAAGVYRNRMLIETLAQTEE